MKKKLAEEKAAAKKNFEEELHRASEGVPDLLTLPDRGWDPDHVLAQVGLCVLFLTVLNLPDRGRDPASGFRTMSSQRWDQDSQAFSLSQKDGGSLLPNLPNPVRERQGSGSRPSLGGIFNFVSLTFSLSQIHCKKCRRTFFRIPS